MRIKLHCNCYDSIANSTFFSKVATTVVTIHVFLSGIQDLILNAFLFIGRFVAQEFQYNSTSDLMIPHGLSSSLLGYFSNPKMSFLVPQPVSSNAQRSTINFGPQVIANKIINLNFLELSV